MTRELLNHARGLLIVSVSALAACCGARQPSSHPAAAATVVEKLQAPYKTFVSFEEAKPLLNADPAGVPTALKGTSEQQAAAWPSWVAQHDAEIRARLERGDEDSIVNLWIYGTTFTRLPRATDRDLTAAGARASQLVEGRLGDLIQGAASPGDNERLQFVRQVIGRHGIDLATEAGQGQAWRYLAEIWRRNNAQNRAYAGRAAAARELGDAGTKLSTLSSFFSDRGLSSDTSIGAGFGLDRTLVQMKAQQRISVGHVHRVAIVGPGLDFTDKTEGYDFYPLQTIQPFALADSLMRLQLAAPDLTISTFDLSPRVNAHLSAARARAPSGNPYTLQLPLERNDSRRQWNSEFEQYWRTFGAGIGDGVEPVCPPAELANVRVRGVRVRPAVVRALVPLDLNIVLERLNPTPGEAPFDLIVATNVLVYYGRFEQALALFNISTMLRPGGYFLTNYAVSPMPPFEAHAGMSVSVFWDRQRNGDTVFAYVRR
jgi:hypothetical protein